MHISKMVDYVKNEINFSKEFCEDNVFVTLRIEPILKIIENLEQSHKDILEYAKEINRKDKQIDLMAKYINYLSDELVQTTGKNELEFCRRKSCKDSNYSCEQCIKKYFERKVKDEN